MEVLCVEKLHQRSKPLKLYQPCKLWIQNQCPNSQASCVYVHSFFCPDKLCCKQEYCTLLHHDLDNCGSRSTKNDINDSESNDFNIRKKCKLSDTEVVVIEDDEIFRTDSPSPAFDDELCQELEAVGEELDKFTKETMDAKHNGSELDIVIINEYPALNKRATHDISENVELIESPTRPDSLSKKEESPHLLEKENYQMQQLNSREEFNFAVTSTAITDQRTEKSDNKIFQDDSGKVAKESSVEKSTNMHDALPVASAKQNFLLKQKSQLVKSARFLVEQRKLLYTERDNVIKRVMGGTKDQMKIKKILDENSRLTKELTVFLQNITHKIQNINDEIEGNAKLVADKVPSQIVKAKEILPTNTTSIDLKVILDKLTSESKGHTIRPGKKETSPQQNTLDLVSSKCPDRRLIHEGYRISEEDHVGNEYFKEINKVDKDLNNKAKSAVRKEAECEQRENQSEASESLKGTLSKCSLKNNELCHKKPGEQTEDISEDKLKTAGDSEANIVQKPVKTMKTSPKDKNTYWCKKCNIFFTSIFGYVEHLESTSHIQNTKNYSHETSLFRNVDEAKEKCADGPPQGVEFLNSTTVFFCELCNEIICNKEEATSHPHQSQHLQKYKEYIQNNLSKEIKFMQEKMFALTEYCKKRQIKVSERISEVNSIHSMEMAQADGECG